MPWVALATSFPAHPKIAGLDDACFRLHVHALCWSVEHLTDGRVSRRHLNVIDTASERRSSVRRAERLCDAGVWIRLENGDYQIHDFDKYQRTKAQVEAERAANRERVARWRRNTVTNAVSNTVRNGEVTEPLSSPLLYTPLPPSSEGGSEPVENPSRARRADGTNPRAARKRDDARRGARNLGRTRALIDGFEEPEFIDEIENAYRDDAELRVDALQSFRSERARLESARRESQAEADRAAVARAFTDEGGSDE